MFQGRVGRKRHQEPNVWRVIAELKEVKLKIFKTCMLVNAVSESQLPHQIEPIWICHYLIPCSAKFCTAWGTQGAPDSRHTADISARTCSPTL